MEKKAVQPDKPPWRSPRAFACLTCLVASMFCLSNCGRDPAAEKERKDLVAANDQLKVKEQTIAELKEEVERLNQELAGTKSRRAGQQKEETDELKKFYEEKLLSEQEQSRQKVASLDDALARSRMDLGVAEKERLALKALLDQPGRLALIDRENDRAERAMWCIICATLLAATGFLAIQNLHFRRRCRDNIVSLVARLSESGGAP